MAQRAIGTAAAYEKAITTYNLDDNMMITCYTCIHLLKKGCNYVCRLADEKKVIECEETNKYWVFDHSRFEENEDNG